VADSLISAAGLVGGAVRNPAGADIGRVADIVARWDGGPYPPVTGLVTRIGRRVAFVPAEQIEELGHRFARLRSARLDLEDFERREGEVVLAGDVVDHQLVDVDGVRVIRAADLYLARLGREYRVVGVDVSLATLWRRLGPAGRRQRPTPERVIDWAAIQPFGRPGSPLRLREANQGLRRLRPAELADLLEELGRLQRQELLAALEPGDAADALEEMEPEQLEALLRDAPTEQAAALLVEMEPDEAVEALRDLDDDDRAAVLNAMPEPAAHHLEELLMYAEDTAGGVMTSYVFTALADETVAGVRKRLRHDMDHRADIDAIVVIDGDGRLVDDVTVFELFVAKPTAALESLLGEPWPVTVGPGTPFAQVLERFIDSRGSSVVVVDDDGRPIGRILADDLVDALVPERARMHLRKLA
jgi:CBS domain-containing protein